MTDTIRIDLKPIWDSQPCSVDKLGRIEHELSGDDLDRMSPSDWRHFDPADLTEYLLPTLGEPRYFFGGLPRVVEVAGRRYEVDVYLFHEDEREWDYSRSYVTFKPTDRPVSEEDATAGGYDYQFFGRPNWIQGAHFPADRQGEPCRHLVTVDNDWGDAGNVNILIGLNAEGIPDVGYVEASCH